jgi:hypothetical protein
MIEVVSGVAIGAGSIILGILGLLGRIPDRSSERAKEAIPQSFFAWCLIGVGLVMILGVVTSAL